MASWFRRDPETSSASASSESRPRVGRLRPGALVSAIAIGSVAATIGVVQAQADPDYPTWDDVQNAKRDEAATAAKIEQLTGLLTGLQATADSAARTQMVAAEKYQQAKAAADDAADRASELTEKAAAANEKAKVSKMRAGLLAAHLARTGGGDVSMGLALDAGNSDKLLYQLGTMTKLSAGSKKIYDEALADQKLASNLGAQAEVASTRRTALATEAQKAFDSATQAADAASRAVSEQEQRQGQLIAQLASLKNTTAQAEAEYQAGLAAQRASAGPVSSGSGTGGSGAGAGSGSGSAGSGSGNSNSGGSSGSGGSTSTQPAPPPGTSDPGPPNADRVATAIAYARAQIGDPYQLGGAGPDRWDCSGLTMKAYGAAGLSIGGHSATAQYNTARSRGQLVPYSEIQPGDLIFYSSGSDMYHVAIYTGGGRMIEAPYEGQNVRERSVWNDGTRYAWVARPTA